MLTGIVQQIIYKDQVAYVTMRGFTQHCEIIGNYVKRIKQEANIDYDAFCLHWIKQGKVPLFEYCSKETKVVIPYEKECLTLLAIRDNETGEYMKYPDLLKCGEEYQIPVVKQWKDAPTNPKDLKEYIYKQNGIEGYVIKFEDGDMYKCKTRFYNCVHDLRPRFVKPVQVFEVYCKNIIDDVLSTLPFSEKQRNGLTLFKEYMDNAVLSMAMKLQELVKSVSKEASMSEFMANKANRSEFVMNKLTMGILSRAAKQVEPLNMVEQVKQTIGNYLDKSSTFDANVKLVYAWLQVEPFDWLAHDMNIKLPSQFKQQNEEDNEEVAEQ